MASSSARSWLGRSLPALLAVALTVGLVAIASQAASPVKAPAKVSFVTVHLPINVWTNVNSGSPASSYWLTQRDAIRVGKLSETGAVHRAFLQADVSSLEGRVIVDARVEMVLQHSWSCSQTPVQLWSVNANLSPSTPVTWNSSGNFWQQPLSTVWAAANATCGFPNQFIQFTGAPIAIALGTAVELGQDTFAVGVRANSETDISQWKRFLPSSLTLIVTYSD
jgi:hypothetical protein